MRTSFGAVWGDRADARWVEEHDVELARSAGTPAAPIASPAPVSPATPSRTPSTTPTPAAPVPPTATRPPPTPIPSPAAPSPPDGWRVFHDGRADAAASRYQIDSTGVAVRPDGAIYVARGGWPPRVTVFTPDGARVDEWSPPALPPQPGLNMFETIRGWAFAPDGTLYLPRRRTYQVEFRTAAGVLLKTIGGQGELPGQFSTLSGPTHVAVHGDGRVFVLEPGVVHVFSPTGEFLYRWAARTQSELVAGSERGSAAANAGLAVAPGGEVYTAAQGSSRVLKFDGDTGALLAQWDLSRLANTLADVAVAPDGLVYVGSMFARVLQFTPDGTLLASWDFGTASVNDVAVDPVGRIYVSDGKFRVLVLPTEAERG